MQIARGYTQCRYGQMHYLEGKPDVATAPALVLLHQNPTSSFEYRDLVAEMAKDRHVIAFDTPGFGMSDAPPAPPGMAGYAAAFGDAIQAMGLPGPVDLYGYHTGTLLAAELALARPELVRRIVYTGIPMFDEAERKARLQKALAIPAPTEDGEPTFQHLRTQWEAAVTNRTPGVPLERAIASFVDRTRALQGYGWAYQGVWSYDYDRLKLVDHPGLLLQPDEMIRDISLKAAATMRNLSIVELPGLNRDIFDLGVDEIAAALRTFLLPLE